MKYIYLSPHLDDAVFSCGGLIWEQTQKGHQVEIWTIFSSDPPQAEISPLAYSLHQEWGLLQDPFKVRREEDQKACQILGARPKYLPYRDCIYRKSSTGEFYYQEVEDIFGGLNPGETDLIDHLGADLSDQLPTDAVIAAPLGIGNHADHEITRKAVSRLEIPIAYYADYPYVREPEGREILSFMESSKDWEKELHLISENGMNQWHQASLAYSSQIPVFWEAEESLLIEIRDLRDKLGGLALWTPVDSD